MAPKKKRKARPTTDEQADTSAGKPREETKGKLKKKKKRPLAGDTPTTAAKVPAADAAASLKKHKKKPTSADGEVAPPTTEAEPRGSTSKPSKKPKKAARRAAAAEAERKPAKKPKKAAKKAAAAEAEGKPAKKAKQAAAAEGGGRPRKKPKSSAKDAAKPGKAAKAGAEDSSDEGSFFTHDERKKASLKKDDADDAWNTGYKKKATDDYKVFIGDLPWSVSEDAVRAHFAVYGAFARFDMPKRDGKSDGSAFIYYNTKAAMEKALEMDGQFFEGRTIKVKQAKAQNRTHKDPGERDRQAERQKKNSLTVFVGGLPFDTDLTKLKTDFEECGEVESIRILKDDGGKFKGTAFVVYKDDGSVKKALDWHGQDYGGRNIIVRRAGEGVKGDGKGKGKGKGSSWNADHDRTVFIGSLSTSTDMKQLESDFGECGPIDTVRMVKDGSGQFKGAAFIVFKTVGGAKSAMEWDGQYYGDRKIKVCIAQNKGRN